MILEPERRAGLPFAAAPWLGVNEFDNRINRLQKVFLAFVCLWILNGCWSKSNCLANEIPEIFPLTFWNVVLNPSGLPTKDGRSSLVMLRTTANMPLPSINLHPPLLHESKKPTLATANIAPEQQPMAEIPASKNHANLGDLYEAVKPLVYLCAAVAGWLCCGWYEVGRHKRKRVALTPNGKSSAARRDNAAGSQKEQPK